MSLKAKRRSGFGGWFAEYFRRGITAMKDWRKRLLDEDEACRADSEELEEIARRTERLREELLSEIYAAATCGMPAMLLDEGRIRSADPEELEEIACSYGIRL